MWTGLQMLSVVFMAVEIIMPPVVTLLLLNSFGVRLQWAAKVLGEPAHVH